MKRSLLLAFLVSVLTTSAMAEGIAVGGRVSGPDGEPLARADVRLIPLKDRVQLSRVLYLEQPVEPVARVLTDEAGRFRIEAPHAGLWRVRVEAPGHAPRERTLEPLIEPIELEAVELPEDTGLVVRVSGSDGEPVAGAFVLVRPERGPFDESGWSEPVRGGRTEPDGTLRLARGQGERVTVTAASPDRGVAELRAHRGTSASLVLPREPARTILVTTRDGRPVPEVVLLVGSRAHPAAVTDDRGRAVLRVAADRAESIELVASDGRRTGKRLEPLEPEKSESTDEIEEKDKAVTVVLPEPILLGGRLIDAETRRAITGAVVYDADRPTLAAVTDRAGGFVLAGSEGTHVRLTAGAPGYLPPERSIDRVLAADGGRPGPTVALRPAAAIEGRVTDADGEAVAGAELTIERRQTPGMMRIEIGAGASSPRARSDDDGRYRLSRIDPEVSYTVTATREGFAPAETSVAGLEAYETRREVDLTMQRGRAIRGTVVSADGEAVADASVGVREAAPEGHGGMMRFGPGGKRLETVAYTDDDGRFELRGLPRGKFDLTVERAGFAPGEVPGIQIEDEAVDAGEIVLQPGETVQGLVTDRDGAPIEGVEIDAAASGGPAMVVMFGDMGGETSDEPDAVTDSTGWFSVSDLSPRKKYTFSASRSGYLGADAGPLPLPRTEPVSITLAPASTVSGSVLDEASEPIAGATVEMTRSRTIEMGGNVMKTVMMSSETTDGDGRFRFEDQQPGEISLKASASGYQEGKLDGLTIPEGADLDGLELKLPAGAVVTGQVFGPDGRPVIGASVQVAGEGETFVRMLQGVPTDGNGVYRLEGLGVGPVSIEATHEDWPRTVRDTEIDLGVNYLDLTFEGGVEVQGRVAAVTGEPVAGAAVRLTTDGRSFGGPSTTTGADGEFRMPGVQDGDYRVWAEAPGYAASAGEVDVQVEGEPIYGVEIELGVGAAIVGRVTGLEEDRLQDVTVQAHGTRFSGWNGVGVDRSGAYRLDHLAAGHYEVVATVAQSGKRATGEVTIEPGVEEVSLDLRFESGLTLSGRALQGGEPVRGATIYVEGTTVQHTGWSETDHEGRFEIDGLEAGDYGVRLRDWRSGLAYDETVSLTADREITLEVPTARVGGRIVDAVDREPLAGVTLTLTSDDAAAGSSRLPTHGATSDLEGKFEFNSVGDGNWTLSASKKGYAAKTSAVAVRSAQAPEELRLSLDPTEGVTLDVRLPTGLPPAEIDVAVLDRSGGVLVGGSYATGENGRVRLSSVPPGRFVALVSAAGSATTQVDVVSPGPAVAVQLPPPTALRVEVPALAGATVATVRLTDASGQPFRGLTWSGRPKSDWRMEGGTTRFDTLPPGSWTVSVASADGRTWQGSRTTVPGAPAELTLE